MKVAIYARYSSDNQRDASIADQFRMCRTGQHMLPHLAGAEIDGNRRGLRPETVTVKRNQRKRDVARTRQQQGGKHSVGEMAQTDMTERKPAQGGSRSRRKPQRQLACGRIASVEECSQR